MTTDDDALPHTIQARFSGASSSETESTPGSDMERFQCPNCHFELTPDDVGVIIFEEATVYHCPICKKTMALMPRFPKRPPPTSDSSQ